MFETEIEKIKKVKLEVIKNLEIQHKKEIREKIIIFDNYYLYLLEHNTKIRDVLKSIYTKDRTIVKNLQIEYIFDSVFITGDLHYNGDNFVKREWRLNGESTMGHKWLNLENSF